MHPSRAAHTVAQWFMEARGHHLSHRAGLSDTNGTHSRLQIRSSGSGGPAGSVRRAGRQQMVRGGRGADSLFLLFGDNFELAYPPQTHSRTVS